MNRRDLRPVMSCAVIAAASAAITCLSPAARADDAEDAKRLFDEARDLAKAGQWPEACEKLEASKRLVPKMLTTYRLADCHEHVGRLASAHAGFLSAAELAKAVGDASKQADAIDRARALEGKLSRVAFKAPKAETNLVVKLDGQPLASALLFERLPLDPGEHALVVTAAGKQPHAMSFHVPPGPATTTVVIPSLEPLGSGTVADGGGLGTTARPTTPIVASTTVGSTTTDRAGAARLAGWATLGVGAVGLGVGAWLGLSAKSLDDDAKALCPAVGCTPEGKRLNDDARSRGNLATVVFGLGAVAASVGVVLVITAPSAASPVKTTTLAPAVGRGTLGLQLAGAF